MLESHASRLPLQWILGTAVLWAAYSVDCTQLGTTRAAFSSAGAVCPMRRRAHPVFVRDTLPLSTGKQRDKHWRDKHWRGNVCSILFCHPHDLVCDFDWTSRLCFLKIAETPWRRDTLNTAGPQSLLTRVSCYQVFDLLNKWIRNITILLATNNDRHGVISVHSRMNRCLA